MPKTRTNYLLLALLASAALLSACGAGEKAAPASTEFPAIAPTATASSSTSPATATTRANPAPSPTMSAATPVASGPLNQRIDVAPDFSLPNANGQDITLSALSAEQPVVLVFYRAFW